MDRTSDFIIDCETHREGKDWDMSCTFVAHSVIAKKKFGNCELGTISVSHEMIVLKDLYKHYGLDPDRTIVLDFIIRNKVCDPKGELVGIGMSMLCNLLRMLGQENIRYIYLHATTSPQNLHKLIALYRKFGFRSISEQEPEKMVAKISNVAESCIPSKKVPVLFTIA